MRREEPARDRRARWPSSQRHLLRTDDAEHAEQLIRETFVGVSLALPVDADRVDMSMSTLRLGRTTAGFFTFGRHVTKVTDELDDFYVILPRRGVAAFRHGRKEEVVAPAEGVVYSPGPAGETDMSPDCAELCLRIPRGLIEVELEQLLGKSLTRTPQFDFRLDTAGSTGRTWRATVDLVAEQLDDGCDLLAHPVAADHIEGLLVDSLLLAQPHNYSSDVLGEQPAVAHSAIRRAVELVQDQPGAPWSTLRLAKEVHLSVRALQEGFKRDLGMPPMAYVRHVRLLRAHTALKRGTSADTMVSAVATSLGFSHMSRFTVAYRETFGELPSETLRRPPQ